jgi:hypothetical protein
MFIVLAAFVRFVNHARFENPAGINPNENRDMGANVSANSSSWSTPICTFDETLVDAIFCWPCTVAQRKAFVQRHGVIAGMMGGGNQPFVTTPDVMTVCLGACGMLCGGMSMCICACQERTAIRRRFNIRTDPHKSKDSNDECCVPTWCPACAIAQHSRELQLRYPQLQWTFACAPARQNALAPQPARMGMGGAQQQQQQVIMMQAPRGGPLQQQQQMMLVQPQQVIMMQPQQQSPHGMMVMAQPQPMYVQQQPQPYQGGQPQQQIVFGAHNQGQQQQMIML